MLRTHLKIPKSLQSREEIEKQEPKSIFLPVLSVMSGKTALKTSGMCVNTLHKFKKSTERSRFEKTHGKGAWKYKTTISYCLKTHLKIPKSLQSREEIEIEKQEPKSIKPQFWWVRNTFQNS